MITREAALRKFVEQYEIDVPESLVENELHSIMLEMRHRMQYDTLTGGRQHIFAEIELEAQKEDLLKAAFYEVKSELVLKAVIAGQDFNVTAEELEVEAASMAKRHNVTVEMIKTFFGQDLAMLARDIKERKAIDWICEQVQK